MPEPAARLEVVAGRAFGMEILVEDELLIGRHATGVGGLAQDEEISRSHAHVALDARGVCEIEDLGSTNGTFVNGLRISAPQTLSKGDTIELGATTLVVREVPDVEILAAGPAQPGARQATATAAEPTPAPPPSPPIDPATEAYEPELDPPLEHAPVVSPEFEPAAAANPRPPILALRLEVDFSTQEARLFLNGVSEPVRLVFDGDAWRPALPPLAEKGTPV